MIGGALFSPDGLYRYKLWRLWDEALSPVLFIGVNPSTADAANNDATMRRVIGFAKLWGHGGVVIVNLFALVSTDPNALLKHAEPVGPDNHAVTEEIFNDSVRIVPCWGAHKAVTDASIPRCAPGRAFQVTRQLERPREYGTSIQCLGKTKDGHPKHPLRLSKTTNLVPF